MKSSKQKPLATVRGAGLTAEIHRAKFVPFESTKYLDLKALKKAKKALIEIGTVEAAGKKATVVAEISKGFITKLRPIACPNCDEKGPKKTAANAPSKKLAREIFQKLGELGTPVTKLPIPVVRMAEIIIGPIIISCGSDGCDICILTDDGYWSCIYCLFSGPGICIGRVIILN